MSREYHQTQKSSSIFGFRKAKLSLGNMAFNVRLYAWSSFMYLSSYVLPTIRQRFINLNRKTPKDYRNERSAWFKQFNFIANIESKLVFWAALAKSNWWYYKIVLRWEGKMKASFAQEVVICIFLAWQKLASSTKYHLGMKQKQLLSISWYMLWYARKWTKIISKYKLM